VWKRFSAGSDQPRGKGAMRQRATADPTNIDGLWRNRAEMGSDDLCDAARTTI
jgi:hypothetical protein